MIDAIIAIATLCLKAVELVVSSESTAKDEVRSKCEDIRRSVRNLQGLLPGYSSSAACSDGGTAAALRRLEAALRHASYVVESCSRHAEQDSTTYDLARLVAAEEKIERCIRDVRLAAAVAPLAVRQRPTTTPIVHNHYYNNICDNRVDRRIMYNCVEHQAPLAMASGSGSSRTQQPQMPQQLVPRLMPSPQQEQRRPTAAAAASTARRIAAAIASSVSRQSDHGASGFAAAVSSSRGATPSAAPITARAARSAPQLRRSSTTSYAHREHGGLPGQRATARPAPAHA